MGWVATSLSAVNKIDPRDLLPEQEMDCRPVAMGNTSTLRKVTTKTLLKPYSDEFIEATKPTQYGCGEVAGGSQMAFKLQLQQEARPDHVIIALDVKNAYNEVKRSVTLDALWSNSSLNGLHHYFWKNKMMKGYVGLGSGERMQKADFSSDEGEQQGAPESGPLFCIAIDAVNRETNIRLNEQDGFLIGRMDDTYIVGPPELAFNMMLDHKRRLSEIGLELNIGKTKCYINPNFRTPRFHLLRDNVALGTMPNLADGAEEASLTHGIVCYGVPVGDENFVESFLIKKANRIVGDLDTIGQRMAPHVIAAPELPSRQCLWQIILRCLQHKGTYWCQHLPPEITAAFSRRIDLAINQLVLLATEIDLIGIETSDFTKERCQMPMRSKGLGIRELEDRRNTEFIGGAVQGISYLMDRK